MGAIGAGLNFTGLQLARIIDGHVHWMAESCPIAQPAGLQLTRWAGYRPEVFAQAEDPALSHPRMGVAVEAITLSCAPWSISGDGDKIEAALRELCPLNATSGLKNCYHLTMAAILARPPRFKLATQAGRWALGASARKSGAVMADDAYHIHGIQLAMCRAYPLH